MSALLFAWRLAKPLLPCIAAALVVLGLLSAYGHREYGRGKRSRDAEVAALNGTIKNMEDASARAQFDNFNHVRAIEAKQDRITKDHAYAYPKQLADARAALAAYVRLHPAAKADSGGAGKDGLPGLSDAAGRADAAPANAIVPVADLDACAAAYTTAVGLQGWIKAQVAIDRNSE